MNESTSRRILNLSKRISVVPNNSPLEKMINQTYKTPEKIFKNNFDSDLFNNNSLSKKL
jgi:hypothetical protein